MSPAPFEVRNEALDDGVRAFTVRGELDMNTAPELERQLEEALVRRDDASIMLDLSECEFIDSTGIALIVRAWQRLDRDAGGEGRAVWCSAARTTRCERLLKITGVESSISMHESRDSALADLRGSNRADRLLGIEEDLAADEAAVAHLPDPGGRACRGCRARGCAA